MKTNNEETTPTKPPMLDIPVGEYSVIGITIYREEGTIFINGEQWLKKKEAEETMLRFAKWSFALASNMSEGNAPVWTHGKSEIPDSELLAEFYK
jgi:hypothetical protein